MSPSPDEALRARAAFDSDAAEILRLAVERGLISEADAETAASEVMRRYDERHDPSPTTLLARAGVLDQETLVDLARDVGVSDPRGDETVVGSGTPQRRQQRPRTDVFEVLPVHDWDRYEFIELIGRGGMGDVYKARDPRLGRHVALKFLRRDEPDIAARFIREARVQARIDHDNVCQVYEAGEVEGHPYIAMQYISGGSLKQISDLVGPREKAAIMVDVADALHAAHQAGLIHRDVKPANILVERDEEGGWRPYVVDFGIARDAESREMTVSGMVLGTPAFAAPEQVRGENRALDRRTDVYSLGATLYWFLTDRPPYEGGYPEVLAGITARDPEPPHRLDAQIPVDLENIVLKCLEKEPQRRYATAREVSEDLRRFLAGEPITARPASLIYKISKKIKKHRGLTLTVAGMLVLVAVISAFSLTSTLRTRRRAAIAQSLVEQVSEIERLVRISSMMPLHDRRDEDAAVRARIAGIAAAMDRLGRLSLGPGHYALGRSYLALQDLETARRHLEAALEAGYDSPGVYHSLGMVLGRLYERELDHARQLEDESLRTAFRRQIETELKEPALAYLRRSPSPPLETTAYAEGLIAMYEGRWDEALAKAKEASERVGWLYEAKKLEGDVHVELGAEHGFRGDYDAALNDLELAGEDYRRAAVIARSDASIYDGDCERWTQVMEAKVRRGASADEAFAGAVAACGRSLQVDPDRAPTHERLAFLYWRWADVVHDRGADPSAHLERAVAEATRAIEIQPSSASAHYALGGALTVAGLSELGKGRDPRPTLERAVASLERALELEPRMVPAHDDLGYAWERIARYELSVGADPRPSLDRAGASFRQAIRLNPQYANAYNNLGIALWRRASYELKTGHDPGPSLDEALAAFASATSLNSNYANAFANRGLAYRTRALYALEQGDDPTPWLEEARANLDRAVDINPKVYWAYPERAATEILAARWAMRSDRDPGPFFDRAATAAQRALAANAANAVAFQTAAEVHRWRALGLVTAGEDPSAEVAAGRRLTAQALRLNPGLASAMVTDAALLMIQARGSSDPGARRRLSSEAAAHLRRATRLNPLLAGEAQQLGRELPPRTP